MRDTRTNKLASNIRAERSRKGVSQEFLCEKLNISTRTLSSIENSWQKPSIFVLIDIAKALEIDINILLDGV
ncbi:MAG: helix-turn-helix transcriptional regulator [Candidatus Gastranaerophilales bacterium]